MNEELITRILKGSRWNDQAFTWDWENMSRSITWNITRAIKLTSIRKPDGMLALDTLVAALKSNNQHAVNMDYAPFLKVERLKQPILVVMMPEHGINTHIIIDGWQRVYRAVQLKIDLPFYILTKDEDDQCRIYDVIYL